jgi:hypothetical protein
MCSRQYVAQGATGCSAKGKTIAKSIGDGLFFFLRSFALRARRSKRKVEGLHI